MMNYNEFAEAVKEQIKDYLPAEFKVAEVQTVQVKKNNDVEKTGISIKYSTKVSAVFYPEDLYIPYQKGVPFEEIMKKMAKGFLDSMISEEQVRDMDFHYDAMKDKLFVSVCNASKNAEILSGMPHEIREDLALIYKAYMNLDGIGDGIMMINNDMMEIWGISEGELREQAWRNMHRILPHDFRSMISVLSQYAADDELSEELSEELLDGMKEVDMYVLTNVEKKYGASYMFDQKLLEQISQKLGGDLMVIPSSVHEVLIKKIDADMPLEVMKDIIEDINEHKLMPEEVLSGEVYIFDSSVKKLSIAKEQEEIHAEAPKQDQEHKLADGLMTFQEFKETVLNEMRCYLPKDFKGQISIEAVQEYDLPHRDELVIRQNGSTYVPHIDLGAYYDFHKARVGMEDILKSIASTYRAEIKHAKEYAQRVGDEECAGISDELAESPENDGQSFGMDQSM